MSPIEIDSVLDSLVILRDTREQETDRAKRRHKRFGVPCRKAVLDFGDYTYQATLPDGGKVVDESERIMPLASVERKMNLDELAGCFTHDRARFQREMERAKEHGARMYVLVENATWEQILLHRYRSKFLPKSFLASITAWMVRYDLQIIFCKEETTPILIKEILYRDLKERLTRGEFDAGERMDKVASKNDTV